MFARILSASFAALLMFGSTVYPQDEPPVSPVGYYEGSTSYGAQFLKNQKYIHISMKSKSDFWFVVMPDPHNDKNLTIHGQGLAEYDLSFGVDWTMAAKLGLAQVKGIAGLSLDPNVTLKLNPKTATQKYYLSGSMSMRNPDKPTMDLTVSWLPPGSGDKPPQLELQLVGTLTASGTGGGGGMTTFTAGAGLTAGTVVKTIKVEPNPPFGTDSLTPNLGKRSSYGPFAIESSYSGPGGDKNTEVTVRWKAVQRYDFALLDWMAKRGQKTNQPSPSASTNPSSATVADWRSGTVSLTIGNEKQLGPADSLHPRRTDTSNQKAPTWGKEITFDAALPNDRYSVGLTLARSSVPCSLMYSNKTPAGFKLIVRPDAPISEGKTEITVDWLAIPPR